MCIKKIACLLFTLCLLFLVGCSPQEPAVPDPKTTTAAKINYITIKDKDNYYTVSIPSKWDNSVKKSTRILTEKGTGCEIRIDTQAYFPEVNNITQESLSKDYSADNVSLTAFNQQTGNIIDYTVSYTNSQNKAMFQLVRLCWTKEKVYHIYYEAEEKYYDTFLDVFKKVLNSFIPSAELDSSATYLELWGISENSKGYYIEDIGCYCEYPLNYTVSTFEDGISITNPETYAVTTLSYFDKMQNFAGFTELDYQDFMQSQISGIGLSSFQNSGNKIDGELYYSQDGIQYYVYNILFDADYCTLSVTYVAANDVAENGLSDFNNFANSVSFV